MSDDNNKFKNGKIYTIRNRNDDTLIYVGSTVQPLYKRLSQHKIRSKNPKYENYILYKKMNETDFNDWYIELFEDFPCDRKEQLSQREGQIIRGIGTLNKRIEGRTDKEYYLDNKEKILVQSKEYYEINKEKVSERHKEYRDNNKDKMKEYYEDNKENFLKNRKQYRKDNKEKISEYYKNNKEKRLKYIESNKEKILEYHNDYRKANKEKINERRRNNFFKKKLEKKEDNITIS